MAVNKDSSTFTFTFAIIMVIIVGAALSITAMSLKPFQQANVKKEKMKDILESIKVEGVNMNNSTELFAKYVRKDTR